LRTVNRHLSKRGRTYYLIKRVPDDVRELHPGEGTIRESLKTTDLLAARRIRDVRLKELEAKWNAYRALPKGQHLDRSLFAEALELRDMVQGPDRAEVLELVEERAQDIYDGDVPEPFHVIKPSAKAAEFYGIASGKKFPTKLAVEDFLAGAKLKHTTRKLYAGLLKLVVSKYSSLEEINETSILSLVREYQKGHTAKSVGNLLTATRNLLHYHGYTRTREAIKGVRIDADKPLIDKGVWSPKEVIRLTVANTAPEWLRDCITVAAYSGLRAQEIRGLVYDAGENQLVVPLRNAKTKNSVRRVACHPKAKEASKRLASASVKLTVHKLSTAFRELVDRLDDLPRMVEVDGVPMKRDFHALRHTFASKLTSLGAEESTIKRILGHSTKGDVTRGYRSFWQGGGGARQRLGQGEP
jgi:integrase